MPRSAGQKRTAKCVCMCMCRVRLENMYRTRNTREKSKVNSIGFLFVGHKRPLCAICMDAHCNRGSDGACNAADKVGSTLRMACQIPVELDLQGWITPFRLPSFVHSISKIDLHETALRLQHSVRYHLRVASSENLRLAKLVLAYRSSFPPAVSML